MLVKCEDASFGIYQSYDDCHEINIYLTKVGRVVSIMLNDAFQRNALIVLMINTNLVVTLEWLHLPLAVIYGVRDQRGYDTTLRAYLSCQVGGK